MAKLYPPQIEGTLPAFYKENEKVILKVPFIMNKVVNRNEIKNFVIKIKSILNNEVIHSQYATAFDFNEHEVQFNIENYSDILKLGQYYKIQIAYVGQDNVIGYYSTVGIIKYTSKPKMEIEGLVPGELYAVQYYYTGKYSQQNQDVTEKLYSYEFIIYDQNNNIYDRSGEQLHNHEKDENGYESIDTYTFTKTLVDNNQYYLVYTGITSNGLKVSSPKYKIYAGETVEPTINVKVIAEMDYENGISNISLNSQEKILNGNFILSRASNKDNFSNWYILNKYKFIGKRIDSFLEKDFTLEHGYTYQYSLQQINSDESLASNRIKSNLIDANFDSCFLYDGNRQLKIAFNPKISSFKQSVLESKTNSIGGKYPYFFKNGYVNYKEFGISGLISYLTDNEQYFLSNDEMFLDDYSHFVRQETLKPNITSENLDYFYNQDDLGQAYMLLDKYKARDNKSSEYSLIKNQHNRTTNLEHYNFLAERIFKLKVLEFLNNGKPKLFRSPAEGNYIVQLLNSSLAPNDQVGRMLHTFTTTASEMAEYNITNLKKYGFIDSTEKSFILNEIQYKNIIIPEESENKWSNILNSEPIIDLKCYDMFLGDEILLDGNIKIVIGSTGVYNMKFEEPIKTIQVKHPISPMAKITYGYQKEIDNYFDNYKSIKIIDVPCKQVKNDDNTNEEWINIKTLLENNPNEKIIKLYKVFFTKLNKNDLVKIKVDNNEIDFSFKDEFYINDATNIKEILIGKNVVANITYQKKIIEYVEEREEENNEQSSS